MKHITIPLLFAASCNYISHAQVGVQVGWNVTKYQCEINGVRQIRRPIIDFAAGVIYHRKIRGAVSIQPSLLFIYKGARSYATPFGIEYYKTRFGYVQLSLPVLYSINLRKKHYTLDLGAGPHVAALMDARERAHAQVTGGNEYKRYKIGTDLARADGGISFIVGVRPKRYNIYLQYDLGLTDVDLTTAGSIRNRCLSVNLAVMFGAK